jgi:signal peptidase II
MRAITLSGPLTKPGLIMAAIMFALDQAHKWLMITTFGFLEGDLVRAAPFLDLVLVWNKGISYGLFAQDTRLGRAVLLAIALVTCLVLVVWLARAANRPVALALGAIIGGALGNALDRLVHGAVADFFSLHAFGFYWYVFNIADVAIVAGVVVLLYDALIGFRS